MGIIHKKKPPVVIQKGIIEDEKGKKYNIDFVGDNNDFVNISYPDENKKRDDTIKILLRENENEIHDICFINDYSHLLVGCDKGKLYVYKRIINNKSNLKFEEVTHFKPHESSIIQIIKLQTGHILTLCSDSSSKIVEIDTNNILDENDHQFEEIQTLLNSGEEGNNSAIELESGNLIISQGYFINFFEKNTNGMSISESLIASNMGTGTGTGKEYHLSKKIFTNSDNIFFIEIDSKTVAASQVSNKTLLFYNVEDYSLIKTINKIEFSGMKNCMYLINKETLAIGGNNGSIYLVNTLRKQLFSVTHFENCDNITCIKSIDDETIIMGCQYWTTNFDVIIYKIKDNKFQEIKRKQKTREALTNDIKLITMDISNNTNPFTNKFNVITLGLDYKVKLLLDKTN